MERRHGILLIDKEEGMTSHDVVAKVRSILATKEVGHAGTLDPMATGLLVLLCGEATKLSSHILEQDKSYEAVVRLGVRTTTGDRTGEVLAKSETRIAPEEIQLAVQQLQGTFSWEVPAYSAVKVQGQKLYERARQGEEFALPLKEMSFYDVQLLGVDENLVRVRLSCSKGSYIRTWGEKLGERLKVGGTLESLRRLGSKPFGVEQAWTLGGLREWVADGASDSVGRTENGHRATAAAWVEMAQLLPNARAIWVQGVDEKFIVNGQISKTLKSQLIALIPPSLEGKQLIRILSKSSRNLLALVGLEKGKGFSIERVFRY